MAVGITPAASEQRTKNPLRPERLDEVIGQEEAKALFRRAITSCYERKRPLDHTLIVGPSGVGKTTFSHVVANELGVDVYELEAPVSSDTLLELRTTMYDGDILKIEEIHQQAIMERRGRAAATSPEILYAVMEDRTIATDDGVLEYPSITIMGTTTDEGMLPDAFVSRFPLRPRLVAYTRDELKLIAIANARALDMRITHGACGLFADASRGVPRQINTFVKNGLIFTPPGDLCDKLAAQAVLRALGVTSDGLTSDMQAMLRFLYEKSARTTGDGEVVYQASVNTIATAIGKSRDSKAIALRVEPFLIERGFVQVTHGGRRLTDRGINRALALIGDNA